MLINAKEQLKEVLNAEVHRAKGFKICSNCLSIIKDGDDYALTREYNNQIKLCKGCYKIVPLDEEYDN